jgi:hypothetical protein
VLDNSGGDYMRGFRLLYGKRPAAALTPIPVVDPIDAQYPDGRCARCKARLPSDHEQMVIKLYGFYTDRPRMFSRRSCVSCPSAQSGSLKKYYISRGINGAAGQD